MKNISLYFGFAIIIFSSACSPKVHNVKTGGLEKLVYHSSPCFGSCPQIDLEIDRDRNLYVKRKIFAGKGEEVPASSGNFQGQLSVDKFTKLEEMVHELKADSLKVETVTCCDMAMKTLIIYHHEKRSYFKTMTPPKKSDDILEFLQKIALSDKLTRVETDREIEN